MSLKKLAHTAGRTTAFKTLGLVKTALSTVEIRALAGLAGGTLGGIAGARSDKDHRVRNALIGAAGGSLLGLGGAELGLRMALPAERAVARSMKAAPAAEQAVARSMEAAPAAEQAVARSMEAAPAAEQAVVGGMPRNSGISFEEMPTSSARRVDIQNLPDLDMGFDAETNKRINEEYKRLVEPVAQYFDDNNPELAALHDKVPNPWDDNSKQHPLLDALKGAVPGIPEKLQLDALGPGPHRIISPPQGHYSFSHGDLGKLSYSKDALRDYSYGKSKIHERAMQDAVRKVVGGVSVTDTDVLIHALNNPLYRNNRVLQSTKLLKHGLPEDHLLDVYGPAVLQEAKRNIEAGVTHPLHASEFAEAANTRAHRIHDLSGVPERVTLRRVQRNL